MRMHGREETEKLGREGRRAKENRRKERWAEEFIPSDQELKNNVKEYFEWDFWPKI